MLTAWMIAQQDRIAPPVLSPETEALVRARIPREKKRQLDEVAINAVLGVFAIVFGLFVAGAGAATSRFSSTAEDVVRVVGADVMGAVAFLVMVHLARYLDALITKSPATRWPRASSDADFVAALAASVIVLSLTW